MNVTKASAFICRADSWFSLTEFFEKPNEWITKRLLKLILVPLSIVEMTTESYSMKDWCNHIYNPFSEKYFKREIPQILPDTHHSFPIIKIILYRILIKMEFSFLLKYLLKFIFPQTNCIQCLPNYLKCFIRNKLPIENWKFHTGVCLNKAFHDSIGMCMRFQNKSNVPRGINKNLAFVQYKNGVY